MDSTIGHSNGTPYINVYTRAKKQGLLNTFDVHPVMHEYIKNQYKGREIPDYTPKDSKPKTAESGAKPKL